MGEKRWAVLVEASWTVTVIDWETVMKTVEMGSQTSPLSLDGRQQGYEQTENAYLRGQSRCRGDDGSQANDAGEDVQDSRAHLEVARRDCGEGESTMFVCCKDCAGG